MLAYYLNPLDYLFGSMARRGSVNQVAMGASLGMMLGLTPIFSGLWLLALICVLVFNVSLRAAIVVALLVRALGVAFIDQHVSYPLGYWVIEDLGASGEGIGVLFKWIGETPALAWTGAHHWYAGGATILALLAFVPFFYLLRFATTGVRKLVRRLAKRLTLKGLKERRLMRWTLWLVAPSVLYAFYDAAKEAQGAIADAGEELEEASLAELLERSEAGREPRAEQGTEPQNNERATQAQAEESEGPAHSGEASAADEEGAHPELEQVDDLDELELDDDFAPAAAAEASPATPPPPTEQASPFAEADAHYANQGEKDAVEEDEVDFEAVTRPRKRGKAEEKAAKTLVNLEEEEEADKQVKAAAKAEKKIGKAASKVADKEEKAAQKADKGRRASVEPSDGKKKRSPGRLRKWFVIPLLLAILLPAGAFGAAYLMRDAIVKWAIEGPTAERMDMTITLEGVDFDIASGVITLRNVVMQPHQSVPESEPVRDIDPRQPLFQASELYAELDLEQLFQGRLHFTLRAEDPTLTLVRLPDGSMSYASPAMREPGPLGRPRPAQPAERVRTPEGEPAVIVDEQGRELHVFRDEQGERILAERELTPEGETQWLWTDETGQQRRERGEAPLVDERKPRQYDPESSSTLEEIRRFIEQMIEEYRLDDPDTWKESYTTAKQTYEAYGPHVRRAFERARGEDGTLDEEELERIAERFLLGSATYVEQPVFEPGPNLPLLWCREFSITNLTVNYVDLRPEREEAWSQHAYSIQLRNLATNRELLGERTVALISRGLENEEVRTLVDAALEAEEAEDTEVVVEDEIERIAARALATRLHLHIEHGLELNEIAGLFEREAMPFEGGSVKLYTAVPGFHPEEWFRPEVWYFDSATGEVVPERARLPRGPVGLAAANMDGVVVIELEGVRLSAGAFGLPHEAIRFVNEILGDEAEADWRFVLELSGPPHTPRVRLVNEPELLAKLRLLAVRAVTLVAQRITGEALRLMEPVIDWERFAEHYLARPEAYIIWEQGVADSARLLAELEASDERTRARVEPVVGRLRNVVSPLLFADHRELFLYNLGHNSVQVLVIVARDRFNEVAATVLDALLAVVPLEESEESIEQRRTNMREQMVAGVAEALIPELEVSSDGELRLATGEAYDFERHSRAALGRFVENSNPVVEEIIHAALAAGIDDVLRIVTRDFMPEASEAQRETKARQLRERLLVGVAEPLVPRLVVDERERIVLADDEPYERRAEQSLARFRGNVAEVIGEEVTLLIREFIDSITSEVEERLEVALAEVPDRVFPRDFDQAEIPQRLRDGLELAVAPEVQVDENMRVSLDLDWDEAQERARGQLAHNAVTILRDLSEGYLDEAMHFLDEQLGEYPPEYPREEVREDLRHGVAEALFPQRTDERGMPVLTLRAEQGQRQLVENMNRVAPRMAPVLVDRLLAPVETSLEELFAPIELPEGWTMTRIAEELREGVVEAYLTEEPIHYREGAYSLRADRSAAVERAEANAVRLASQVAHLLVQAIVEQTVEEVVELMPALPPGYTSERIAEEVGEGVGEASVRGERARELVLDLDAGAQRADRNAIVVLREMADVMLAEPAQRIAVEVARVIDPLPEGETQESIANRLVEGLGERLVKGERLSEVVFDRAAGLNQLAINATLLGRVLAEPMLEAWARELIAPIAEMLEPYGERFALTADDLDRAAEGSVRGVGSVLFGPHTVEVTQEGELAFEPQTVAARRMLEANVELEVGKLITLNWRRHILQTLEATIEPLLTERTREQRGESYWAARTVWIVPSPFGHRWLRAEEEARGELTQQVAQRLEVVLDEESAQAMLDQVTRILAERGVGVEPPLSTEEMTDEEREAYREAESAEERLRVMREFMKRNDRVLDAIAETVPGAELIPVEERRRRARDIIDRLD